VAVQAGEKWVGWASGACALHCIAHPALVLVLPLAAAGERLEAGLLAGLVCATGLLLWSGFRRHRFLRPAAPVGFGLVLWLVALTAGVPEPVKAALIAGGGALSFWGLSWSRALVRACGECPAGTLRT
jgi:uncharacterized membrane protein YgdD (TMEM256/DUF423 family)